MLKEDTEYKSTSEVENTKPQLRMVDLNLLRKVRISRSFLPKLTR